MELSGYRCMWLIAMFDLPMDTPALRRHYARFRKLLLKDGFTKLQFSVYIRHCASRENAEVHTSRLEDSLPPSGEVRVLTLTDKQFEHMRVFRGKKRAPTGRAPAQLELF